MIKFFKNKGPVPYQAKGFGSGFAMVEILVAAAIIAGAFLSAMAVAQKSIYLSRLSMHQSQSALLLEEGAEAVRIVRDNAWANILGLTLGTNYYPTFSGGTWTLSTTSNTIGIFTRKVVFSAVNRDGNYDIASSGSSDSNTKLVTVTVTWLEGGTTLTKTLKFYLFNIFS